MRFGTSLFAALVLAGALANEACAQVPSAIGPYSVYGPGLTYRQDSSYTGPYSTRYPGPYSTRSSSTSPATTSTDSSLRTAGLITQTGRGMGQSDGAARSDAERAPTSSGVTGARRPRYVRLGISGNAIQGIVIP